MRLAGRKPDLAYPVFVTGALLFMGLNVLGHYYFNFALIGDTHRLIPELDMAMILFGIDTLGRLWHWPFPSPLLKRAARAFVVLIALVPLWTQRNFIGHAWDLYPKENDYQHRVEYRISDWMAQHLPDSRTFVAGSVRFWWDAWRDNAEVYGGSDQGLMNPNVTRALWEETLGNDPDLSVRWLQSLGADAVIVSDSHSQDAYHDFKYPYKFAGVLPVLYDDHAGDVIYGVPRRDPSLARVVDSARSKALKPVEDSNLPASLRAYSDLVEQGPDSPATTHWNGTDSISVHANPQTGQSVVVQVTYDPAWHAWSGSTELPIRRDSMDFMAIDAPPGPRDVVLIFQKPLENSIGDAVSALALLLCLILGVRILTSRRPTDSSR